MGVLPTCMSLYRWCKELNPGPLEKHPLFLTTDSQI
uniref:Uncharacterized protein n=1 Tax=Trichinella nativa TaxID=6335 RepID=A0A0V1KGX8_9BILA